MKNKCGDPIELGTSRSNSNLENKIYDDAAAQVSKDSVYDNTEITLTHDDRIDMERMGKKQVLRRNFRLISTIGFTTCVMGTWEILLASNSQGLTAGGSAGIFWSLCLSYTGQFFIVLSLAEMASMAPTAGGQYHWVSEFAPRSCQRILSYVSGWLSTLSWQSIIVVDCYILGGIIQGAIVVYNPDYVPERWQATLLTMGSSVFVSAFNIYAAKHLPLAEGLFATFHVFAFIPVIAIMWTMAPDKKTAAEVFTQFTDNGAGWPSMPLSVMVGQVSTMFVVLGSDSVAHLAEEIENAGVIVPKAMLWSFLLNMPFTFVLLVTYLFVMTDISAALASDTGYPFIYIFETVTGTRGGTLALTIILLILLMMITISALASSSRQTWAFARDRGLPFSHWLSRVHPRMKIPHNAIWQTCMYTFVLSLINVGSTVAFNAVLSLSSSALMGTYLLSIGCVAQRRVRDPESLPRARWSLGRAGLPINCVALTYATWCFFWSFWPNEYRVNEVNFNWASVLFVGVMGLAAALYIFYAKRFYEGPVVKVKW